MHPRRFARGLTAILLGLAIAAHIHHREMVYVSSGLDTYLKRQTRLFNTMPQSYFGLALVAGIFVLVVLWLYEALVWLLERKKKIATSTLD